MEVQAECPWCGMVSLRPEDVRCEAEPRSQEALCEITCPVCARQVYARTTGEGVRIIKAAGGQGITGLVPFELLERRSGPALRWDEVLDLLVGLEYTLYPQAELVDKFGAGQPRVASTTKDTSAANSK